MSIERQSESKQVVYDGMAFATKKKKQKKTHRTPVIESDEEILSRITNYILRTQFGLKYSI